MATQTKIEDDIRSVKKHVAHWKKEIAAGKVDLRHANRQANHFQKVADHAVEAWFEAEKHHDEAGKRKAKAAASNAHQKAAFWQAEADDLRDGQKKAVARKKRQQKHLRILRQQAQQAQQPSSGAVVPKRSWNPLGRKVPVWMVPILDRAQQLGWTGYVVSGVRTPAESVALCRGICGHDSCSGTCAGLSSNHNCTACGQGEGAVDVTDYYRFATIMRSLGNPLRNDLPNDRVHFSRTGH